ncbi:Transmembrane 9 superfamily member 3 [Varanus komodoensis]|nr:Transmembrane 9 superfamily member 3 [Varanus komodoensis]
MFSFQYHDKEEVVLWMNTVGPYHNRQETYKYFSLPFCGGSKKSIGHYHETLGEALQGVELEFSGLDIKFKDDVMQSTYCEIALDKQTRDAFAYAVKNHYWYQMYMDDLPIWGIVGEADENGEDYYLWTYKKLEIGYNGNRIVDVNLTSEGKVKLVPNTKIQMSYSVKWKRSDVKFEDRFDKYLDPSFFQHRIHWFSIFNSFMMVIFLVGLVSMILMRTLRKDYARYSKEEEMDDMDRDLGDEYGWKQVHGDVFRPSSHPLIFSSLIGSGCQIFAVSFIVIIVAMLEDLYTERGSMLSTAIFVYAATSPVNGYFGGSLYARQGGRRWIKQMFIGAFLIPAMVCGTAFFINFIAIYYHASRAIPFGTMLALQAENVTSGRLLSVACGKPAPKSGRLLHLLLRYPSPEPRWHDTGTQPFRAAQLSLSGQCRSSPNPREKMAAHCILAATDEGHRQVCGASGVKRGGAERGAVGDLGPRHIFCPATVALLPEWIAGGCWSDPGHRLLTRHKSTAGIPLRLMPAKLELFPSRDYCSI